MAFRVHVAGERAVFLRPEFAQDDVSYEIITPRAARAIVEAVHWRPAIRWIVDRINVLKMPKMMTLPSQAGNRRTVAATDVAFVLDVHFEMTEFAGPSDNPGQHAAMFKRRMAAGRFHRQPYLGRTDCPASIQLLSDQEEAKPAPAAEVVVDWGWVLHDIASDGRPRYFRAISVGGMVQVPPASSDALMG